MKKKDILVLCQYFYPAQISSATLPTQLCTDLVRAGFKVDVLCSSLPEYTNVPSLPRKEEYQGVGIRRLWQLPCSRVKHFGRIVNFLSFCGAVLLHLPCFRGYDTILVYTTPPILPIVAALGAAWFRKRLVVVCFDLYPQLAVRFAGLSPDSKLYAIWQSLNRFVYKRADALVALSGDMQKTLYESGAAEERVQVIPTWYEPAKRDVSYMPCATLRKLRRFDGFVVSYCGNMGICQDMDTLLAVAQQMQGEPIRFIFAGHGCKQEALREQVERLRLAQVCVLDFLTGPDYDELLDCSDCLVISILDGVERCSAPSKTASYLSAGKPILGIMQPESEIARELSRAGAALVSAPGDVKQLLKNLQWLRRHPKASARMAAAARRLFEKRYDRVVCTRQLIELIACGEPNERKEGDTACLNRKRCSSPAEPGRLAEQQSDGC